MDDAGVEEGIVDGELEEVNFEDVDDSDDDGVVDDAGVEGAVVEGGPMLLAKLLFPAAGVPVPPNAARTVKTTSTTSRATAPSTMIRRRQ